MSLYNYFLKNENRLSDDQITGILLKSVKGFKKDADFKTAIHVEIPAGSKVWVRSISRFGWVEVVDELQEPHVYGGIRCEINPGEIGDYLLLDDEFLDEYVEFCKESRRKAS